MEIFISLSSNKIKIWRIENAFSLLGPYEHGGQIPEVINKGIVNAKTFIRDIDRLPAVQKILKAHPNAVFGFISFEKAQKFVRNPAVLKKHGFYIVRYEAVPLFISEDGQVIFIRPEALNVKSS